MIRYNAYRGAPQPNYLAKRPAPKPVEEPRAKWWTPEEDAIVLKGLDEGWTYKRIGTAVGRSKSAVSSRVASLRRAAA